MKLNSDESVCQVERPGATISFTENGVKAEGIKITSKSSGTRQASLLRHEPPRMSTQANRLTARHYIPLVGAIGAAGILVFFLLRFKRLRIHGGPPEDDKKLT